MLPRKLGIVPESPYFLEISSDAQFAPAVSFASIPVPLCSGQAQQVVLCDIGYEAMGRCGTVVRH